MKNIVKLKYLNKNVYLGKNTEPPEESCMHHLNQEAGAEESSYLGIISWITALSLES